MILNNTNIHSGGALLGLALVFLSGCGSRNSDGYDPALKYPTRTDLVVVSPPPTAPVRMHDAGRVNEWLNALAQQGAKTHDPKTLPIAAAKAIEQNLQELFGTPAAPHVAHAQANALGLSGDTLAMGSKLYRLQCAHCHGLTGDGRGPTGDWIIPRPRDFRKGTFKYTTTNSLGIPGRYDLTRMIRQGIPGTAMQAYELLSDAEIDAIASSVIHLSLRGEVEARAISAVMQEGVTAPELKQDMEDALANSVAKWVTAKAEGVPPATFAVTDDAAPTPARQAAAKRGYELFRSPKVGCASCHVNFGRDERFLYDTWGTAVRVTDVTASEFRGGNRMEDLYLRIKLGIVPSGMPSATALTPAEIWDLAAFVKAAAKPQWLPPEVRSALYPSQ